MKLLSKLFFEISWKMSGEYIQNVYNEPGGAKFKILAGGVT